MTKLKKPKISVIIPAYNHESYIGNTIQSVLEQSYDDFELIIINDGSTDKTEEEIKKFNDNRIVYIFRENRGAHVTINQGIDMSVGEYVCILNSDDIYESDRLDKCLKFLECNKAYSAVITKVEGIDDDGNSVLLNRTPAIDAWLDWYKDALLFAENTDMFINAFAVNILITTSNYFLRRDVFYEVGKFRGLRYAHDWDMLLRLTRNHKVHLIKESLLKYRIHSSNTVHEQDSEAKVKFEVNWLVSESLECLCTNVDCNEVLNALKRNHYLDFEVLVLFAMHNKSCHSEKYLDFNNNITNTIMQLLK